MTPFKRLTEMKGRDAWLETVAVQVAKGDPWTTLAPSRRERLEATALARVQVEQTPRPKWRGLTFALAFAGTAALAALGSAAVAQWQAANAHAPVPAPTAAPIVRPLEQREAPAVVSQSVPTQPMAAQTEARVAVADAPKLIAKSASPRRAPATPVVPTAVPATPAVDALDAEARLLLTALRQLRVDHNPDAALTTLAIHATTFPDGTLKGEAEAARAEAQAVKASRGEP